jgi:hypothetical protein
MTPERWQQVQDVVQKALQLMPEERSGFLPQHEHLEQDKRTRSGEP